MSEAPERVWAFYTPDDFDDTATITAYETVQHGGKEYRRADLPPTLSAARELPEVKAMKEALELARNRLQRLAIEFPTESEWRYEVNEWVEEATAALAAIKEPKT